MDLVGDFVGNGGETDSAESTTAVVGETVDPGGDFVGDGGVTPVGDFVGEGGEIDLAGFRTGAEDSLGPCDNLRRIKTMDREPAGYNGESADPEALAVAGLEVDLASVGGETVDMVGDFVSDSLARGVIDRANSASRNKFHWSWLLNLKCVNKHVVTVQPATSCWQGRVGCRMLSPLL